MKEEPRSQPAQDTSDSQYVRDLKWAITSPTLITEYNVEAKMSRFIDETPIDEQDLAAFLKQYSSFRVGTYFEGLVLYWLEAICKLKIVKQQQQIFEKNRTVGEIDFLFEDITGVLTHWETAVKFYLHFPEDNETGSHFIGPNAVDTFEKKIKRLLEHQLPFSQKYFPEVTQRQAFVKGYIFYHPHAARPHQLPENMSASHLKGTWIRHSEVPWLNDQNSHLMFRVLHKPYWLSPEVSHSQSGDLNSFEELKSQLDAHFLNEERPLLVSVLSCQNTICHEIHRTFIVPESWPQIR